MTIERLKVRTDAVEEARRRLRGLHISTRVDEKLNMNRFDGPTEDRVISALSDLLTPPTAEIPPFPSDEYVWLLAHMGHVESKVKDWNPKTDKPCFQYLHDFVTEEMSKEGAEWFEKQRDLLLRDRYEAAKGGE